MELSQNLSDFYSENNGSGTRQTAAPGGLADLAGFHEDAPRAAVKPSVTTGGGAGALDDALVDGVASREGLSDTQKRVMRALLQQESGYGRNAVTSTDGARGAGQVIPATFSRYAKPDESIDNTEHNLAVMSRIVKDLGGKFGDDPARIAAGYFSGEGNVNAGQGAAWKNDRADGNGKRVSGYVSDVLARLTGSGEAHAGEAPAPAGQPPKWADIAAKPEFKRLSAEQQAAAKASYFDYWIAPRAGSDAGDLRTQFLATGAEQKAEGPGLLDRIGNVLNSVRDAATGLGESLVKNESVLQGAAPREALASDSAAPVRPEVRAAFDAQWDAATTAQRQAMQNAPGWTGQLARARAGAFAQLDQGRAPQDGRAMDALDPRAEQRAARLAGQGEDARFAQRAGREGAGYAALPGREIEALGGTAQGSEFDFETNQAFDAQGASNGLNNPLSRGVAKAVLGTGKAGAGYLQFLAETTGLEGAAEAMKGAGHALRGQEAAIGESGDFMSRNLEGAINSIGQQLPLLLAGVGAASQAIPLAGMAVQSFGQEYSDGRARGLDTGAATARAGLFAAFEVIGEKFGLGQQMEALRGAARGMPSDQIVGLLWSALKKEVPGEVLTTTGQFATDKFAPMGLNQGATFQDYVGQVADTITQTVMQSALMGAGTTGVSSAVRYVRDRGPSDGVANADAELARQQALGKWESLREAGQAAPAPVMPEPAPAHPTSQAADAIVAELAEQTGIPLETVLPTPAEPVAPPQAPVAEQPIVEQAAPAQPAAALAPRDLNPVSLEADEAVSDQDVVDFASSRYQLLREKRDGRVETVTGETGLADQDMPGVGLTPAEQQEMGALEAGRGDVGALRALYGFNATTQQPPVDLSERSDEDLRAQLRNARDRGVINQIAGELQRRKENATDVPEPTQAGEEAGQAQGQESAPAVQPVAEAPAKPRTEKERNQQADYAGKWFGTAEKAQKFIDEKRIADTHGVAQDGKKFIIKKKEATDGAQAAQAQQAETQGPQAPAADELSAAAHGAATSPANDLPEPTEAQKAAGNYKKGHVTFEGLDLTIENPVGSERSGTDPNGQRWAVSMTAHYGYLKRSEGADGDQVDVYLAEQPQADAPVFVFDQYNADGSFDEHKAVVGAGTLEQAKAIYDAHFSDGSGPSRRRAVQAMPVDEFKAWARSADATKPVVKPKTEREARERREATPPAGAPAESVRNSQTADAPQFAGNKIFTADKVAAARERMKKKLGTLNSGLDPELMVDGATIAGAYIESGVRSFKDYSAAMLTDFGDVIRPYLRSFYEAVRHYPGLDTQGMTPAAEIDKPASEVEKTAITTEASIAAQDVAPSTATTQNEPQNSEEPTDAVPVQPEKLPGRDPQQDRGDAAAGDRDRQSVDAGLAQDGEGSDRSGAVPGSAQEPGAAGARGTEQSGSAAPGQARDRAGVRAESEPAGSDTDHVIDADADAIGKGGLGKKFRDNVAAIRLLKAIEAEGRTATPDERKTLARYVGWGAMKGPFDRENKAWAKQHAELKELLTPAEFAAASKSTLDAHYTSPVAVGAMWAAMQRMGFNGGRLLEPSVGVGNFFGLMPRGLRGATQLHGVELDSLTSRMVAALYPTAKIAKATGFEDFQIPGGYFDAVIGNPPFGSQPLVDMERSAYSGFSIHNYFLAKAIDKLRPGGIMQVIVSHNFLDAQDGRARKWIGERTTLIGAVRLPDTAFKENAGTDVVTDILVFQKNDPSAVQHDNLAPWQDVVDQANVNPKTGETVTHKVNQLFAARPDLVLGTASAGGTMYGPNQYTVKGNGDLKAQMDAWVQSLPDGVYEPVARAKEAGLLAMAVPDGVKVGSYFLDANGQVMHRGEDVMGEQRATHWAAPNETAAKRMKGMIGLRDTLRKQMRLERSTEASEAEIEANRTDLDRQYDEFLKAFGHLNSQTNRRLFLDDTESQLVQALEFDYDRGISKAVAEKEGIESKAPSATKADILMRRVAFPPQDFMTVSTAKDALLASLNYRGRVDAAYMAEVYGKDAKAIVEELGDVVFDDPQAGLVTADEYLSGDVKTKLAEAKAAAEGDKAYQRNVAALEEVIPADKLPSEISATIGAAFVPGELYEQFVEHISGGKAAAAYIKATGQWLLAYHGQTDPARNVGQWGTSHLSAQDLFQLSMLGRGAVVKKVIRNADGSTTTIVLDKETEAAREKQAAIRAEWQTWLWADPARADRITSIYNDTMNRIVERKFDGSHMSFPGMNPAISLLAHQKNGVWRGLQTYQTLYDHVVGAGKTFEMTALAMEMRRLGIARKPLFVVPNHLTLQWRSEFTRLYPGSNVLAATPEDFSKDNRERLFSKIVTGDWDAVVIGHSSLKKIGLPDETERAVLQEQIDEVAEAIEEMKRARGDRNIVRDMEGIKARLEARMKEKLAAVGKRSKVVTFDELGIDAMFVDEMHEFKNLTYNTTMDRNAGMGNPAGSAKAFDMFVKVRWLFDTFGAKTPYITATGTPVSNSLVEMFNMQRYMQYPSLKAKGLHVFDAWARQFGSVENVYEVAPSGSGYRQSTRFAKFTNLPALMGLYNSFADTITLDDLKAQEESQGKRFPVPRLVGGRPVMVVAQRSPLVREFMGQPRAELDDTGRVVFGADLSQKIAIEQIKDSDKWQIRVGDSTLPGSHDTEQDARLKLVELAMSPKVAVAPGSILGQFADLRRLTKESKGKINALSLTGQANKAGLDYRLIDPSAPDFPGSKINLAVEQMVRVYRQWKDDKGAQLVFCDLSIPLSARASYSSKARSLYVRDQDGALTMKRGTLHAMTGYESLPFFVVQRGEKEVKRFDVYDAASGALVEGGLASKADAVEAAQARVADLDKRQAWLDVREQAGEIEQGEVDEYNNEQDIEAEDAARFFTREDIAGMSGAAKFSVYDDIKAKLIAKGVPEREIAFIHDYSTPVAKDKLFKAVNAGEIRFLLGSTPKMGAGTNVQQRLVGLHHIDAPWRPSDLEQREGRIIRRGNKLYERDPEGFEVFVGRYATAQTYDTRRWQILEHKARGIEQLRNFDGSINEIDDIEGEAANSADMKAASSGDPMILEETRLRNDVRRLEQLQAGHADERVAMTRRARERQEWADRYGPAGVAEIERLIAITAKHNPGKDGWGPLAINGKAQPEREAALQELARTVSVTRAGLGAEQAVITYRGIEFQFTRGLGETLKVDSPTGQLAMWGPAESFSTSGFVQRLANYVDRLSARADNLRADIEKARAEAKALREQSSKPFGQAGELEALRAEHKKVQRALMAKGPSVPDEQRPAVTDGMLSQRDKLRALGFGDALSEFFGPDGEAALEAKFAAVDDYNDGSGGIKARPTETDLKNVRALNDVVARKLRAEGVAIGSHVLGYVPGSVRGDAALREVARAFGAKVQWFVLRPGLTDLEKRHFGSFNGANFGGVNYLLAAGEDRPHLAIVGHEIVHQLKHDNPDLYAEFEDAVRPFIKPVAYKTGFLNTPVARTADTAEGKHEEFMAEVGSDAFMQAKFWEAIGQHNPTLLRKLVDLVTRLINSVKGKLGYSPKTAPYLADFDKVMEIATDVLGRYMGSKVEAPSHGDESDIKFAAKDGDQPTSFAASASRARSAVTGLFKGDGNRLRTFNAYDKTLSTQFSKALKDRHYGKVFGLVNAMQNEVSLTSIRPAELAPGILPRVDDVKSAVKTLLRGRAGAGSLSKVADAVFAGTLEGGSNVMAGKVWTDDDLRGRFGLDEAGVGLYRQARAAIDASLMELAAAEGYAMSQGFVPKEIRRQLIDRPDMAEELLAGEIRKQIKLLDQAIRQAKKLGAEDQEAELKVAKAGYVATLRKVEQVFVIAKNLQLAGYAPLMRFGGWTVKASRVDPTTGARVVDDNGEPITLFYGQYETEREAMAERKRLEAEHEGDESVRVSAGEKSQSAHELYAGISPETLALFAEAVGMDAATHTYYQEALSERSALKRRLQRKGTSGFSQDMPRVLSSFITSNGRLAAQRYYLRDINNAIKYIPNEKGGVKDEAIALKKFVLNPDDAGGKLSTAMFAWFLGGSIASAAVNLTQPVMMTAPYLSQFGIGEATRAMAKAMPYAMGKKEISDQALRAALKRAGQEGIVDAQEIFHLYSVGAQGVATGLVEALARLPGVGRSLKAGSEGARARAQAFLTMWGSMFALAEGFNRKLTFISAWEVAQARGEKNPYAFAVRAVNETQGIYNKVNRPNWARGKVGRAVLTFKQYSLMYLELLTRMWKRGGPEGKRAALIMLATLMVLSGEEGLPFAQDLDDLIDTVGQLFGLDTNMRRSKREAARQILGEQWADLALHGISSMLPLDFAGRLGLGNLIPGTALLKPSAENGRTREVGEVFGPAAGLAGQAVDAYDAAVEGNTGKALQNLAPTAVKNALAGLEIAAKGAISDAVGRKVVDAKPGDAAWKGIGFNPTTVAREHRKTMPLQQDIALHKRTESSIVDQWARGLADGDQALVAKAEKRLADWNRSNPESRIVIKPTQIRAKVQQMGTDKDSRLLKMAPRELRGRVAEGLDSLD